MPTLVFQRRTSSLSGQPLLSIFSTTQPFPVYGVSEWWSDCWDALSYGRDFDFSAKFFPQFKKLYLAVPKMANMNNNAENCEYCFSAGNAKNCYYSRTVHRSEDIYYSERITGFNQNLLDCLRCQKSSWLYECVQCISCNYSSYLFRCVDTYDSAFCLDCIGCASCFFCSNLRNKSYCIRNRQVSQAECEEFKNMHLSGSYSGLCRNLKEFADLKLRAVWRNVYNINCEDCVGDGLYNSARSYECYNCFNLTDCRYCQDLTPSRECASAMDFSGGGIGELIYNCTDSGGGNYFFRMCANCQEGSNMTYSTECFTCHDCLGCAGLRGKRYCILNKQYSKDEYAAVSEKIIAHMKKTGEWGAFFPPDMSPFPYNHSFASVLFPLGKAEVTKHGWRWEDVSEPELSNESQEIKPAPDNIADVSDSVIAQVFTCPESRKKFKIQKAELAFYRAMKLALPRFHADVRMSRRRGMLNPEALWERECSKCRQKMYTSFAAQRPERVYCPACYQKEVY